MFVDRLSAEIGRLTDLTNDLLTLSRLEEPEARRRRGFAAGRPGPAGGGDRRRTPASGRGQAAGTRPSSAETRRVVLGDDVALRTLIRNLLDNAIRYTEPGGHIAVRVRTETGRDGTRRWVVLAVQDDGVGHPGGRSAPHLRALLPGGQGPVARDRRHRAGPEHRAPRGRAARRPGGGREHPGLRLDLHRAVYRRRSRPGSAERGTARDPHDDHRVEQPGRTRPARSPSRARPQVVLGHPEEREPQDEHQEGRPSTTGPGGAGGAPPPSSARGRRRAPTPRHQPDGQSPERHRGDHLVDLGGMDRAHQPREARAAPSAPWPTGSSRPDCRWGT